MNNFLKILFCYSDLPKGNQNAWIDQFEHYVAFLLFRRGIKIAKNALFLNPNNHTRPHINNLNPDVILMVLIDEGGCLFFNECAIQLQNEFKNVKHFFVSSSKIDSHNDFYHIESFEKDFEGSKEGLASLLDLVNEMIKEPEAEIVLSEMLGQGFGKETVGLFADLKRALRYEEHELTIIYENDLALLKKYIVSETYPVIIYLLVNIEYTSEEREEILTAIKLGGELALENINMSRFLWYGANFLKSEENLSMLDAIKRDALMINSLNIIRSPFEELKDEIKNKYIDNQFDKFVSNKHAIVYLINDQTSNEVKELREGLESLGFTVVQLEDDEEDRDLLKDHRFYLTIADSVIVYQQEKNDAWVNIKLVDLFKAPGFGRKRPFLLKLAIIHQRTVINKGVHIDGLTILKKGEEGFDKILTDIIQTIVVDA